MRQNHPNTQISTLTNEFIPNLSNNHGPERLNEAHYKYPVSLCSGCKLSCNRLKTKWGFSFVVQSLCLLWLIPIPWVTRYFLTHPIGERSVESMEIPGDELLSLTTKEGKLKLARESGSDTNNWSLTDFAVCQDPVTEIFDIYDLNRVFYDDIKLIKNTWEILEMHETILLPW